MLANNNSQPLISPPTSVAVLTVSWLHILVVRKKKVNEANSLWAAQRRQEDQNLIFVNWWCGYKVDAIDLLSNYIHNIARSTISWGGARGVTLYLNGKKIPAKTLWSYLEPFDNATLPTAFELTNNQSSRPSPRTLWRTISLTSKW